VEATYTKFETAHSLHPLPGKGRGRVKDKASSPNHHTKAGEGRRPILASSTGHPNWLSPDPPANRPETMGVQFM